MSAPYTNTHGRRPTRGVRPWLLVPKVLAVATYLGCLVAAMVLWLARGTIEFAGAHGGGQLVVAVPPTVAAVELLFMRVCLPALGVATFFGVLLFFQHPRVFARQRWWQMKIALLVLGTPAGEALVLTGLKRLHHGDNAAAAASARLTCGLALLIGVAVVMVILGRQKPRLGQNWARVAPGNPHPPGSPPPHPKSAIRNPPFSAPTPGDDEPFKL